jgi:hypothetical protein
MTTNQDFCAALNFELEHTKEMSKKKRKFDVVDLTEGED